jgi:hypothetical protein
MTHVLFLKRTSKLGDATQLGLKCRAATPRLLEPRHELCRPSLRCARVRIPRFRTASNFRLHKVA